MSDVVVIGGGPAGASAAIRLARSGRRVRLYEKSHFPRTKLCGGFLSPEGLADLEELGVLAPLRQAGIISLHRTVIASPHGALIESALPEEALSVSRDILDDLLLQEARRSGAQVFEGEDGLPHIDESAWTVIATGRALTRGFASPSPACTRERVGVRAKLFFGIQALFQDVHGVTDQVELDLVKSGYVGLARQRNGTNVCALTTQEAIERYGPSLDEVMKYFMEENPVLRAHLQEASRTGYRMAVGPVRLGIRRLTGENTFYLGDAACVVDPFAGEGMSIGLYSSKLLLRAFDQTQLPSAQAYEKMWKEAFLPALRWNFVMRMLYSVPYFRGPALRALEWFPRGMTLLTDLTRYRLIED